MTTALARAQVLAELSNVKISIRDIVKEWILVVYDLPSTDEGNRQRQKFLKLAPKIGAVMHTKSVYLMPLTNATQAAAVELSRVGNVYIFISQANSKEESERLTSIYDTKMMKDINTIFNRLQKVDKHIADDRRGLAARMLRKTVDLFNISVYSIAQRGNSQLINKLEVLRNDISTLQHEIDSE